jgi:hypothetical protein
MSARHAPPLLLEDSVAGAGNLYSFGKDFQNSAALNSPEHAKNSFQNSSVFRVPRKVVIPPRLVQVARPFRDDTDAVKSDESIDPIHVSRRKTPNFIKSPPAKA